MFGINVENGMLTIETNGIKTQALELKAHGENDRDGSFVAIASYKDGGGKTIIKAVAEHRETESENPTEFEVILPKHAKNPIDCYLKHQKIPGEGRYIDIFEVVVYAKKIILK